MLELKNVPTGLILYAVQQWQPCRKYSNGSALHKNTNTFIKAISVWLILKNETSSGKISWYRKQLPELATKCKMSTRTLDKYINWLRKEKLAAVQDHNLVLESYKVLRRYDVDITEREQTIYYDTKDTTDLSEILISVALMKFKERWMNMYWKKMKQNPDKYNELYNLLVEFKADPERLHEPGYFRECHLELMLQSFNEEKPGHSYAFDFLHEHIQANPDLNARADTYAFKFGYGHAMSFCHLKFRLMRKGLISVHKDNIEGTQRARKDTSIFNVKWLKEFKHTIWWRCDQISVLAEKIFSKKATAQPSFS